MSYTTIKAIYLNDRVEDLEELKNSHGAAPVVWDAMSQQYLNKAYFLADDKLWPLWKAAYIPVHQRAVFMMTFDCAYVAKKDYKRAAVDIRKFLQDFPPIFGNVNHWPHIAELFESCIDIPAIGFQMTSTAEDLWSSDSDENDNPLPLDWTKYYSVYDDLDSLGK